MSDSTDASQFHRFGDYEVLRPIGVGGMAALFLGRKVGLGGFERRLVVKVLLQELVEDPTFVSMFMDEARLAAQLDHPNLVQALDVGTVGPLPFMVMDYVRGPNLARLARMAWKSERVDHGAMAWVMAQACRGLHHAHELTDHDGRPMKIVHRDVSPNNVVVSEAGVVKLIDFGVARDDLREAKTRTGTVKGKLQYMPPEQLLGNPLDRRADVYAAGVSLYVITTSENPVVTDGSAWGARMKGSYKRPTELVESYPEALEAIVLRAMAPEPEDRYPSAAALADDLEAFASTRHITRDAVKAWVAAVFPGGPDTWHRRPDHQSTSALLAAVADSQLVSATMAAERSNTDVTAVTSVLAAAQLLGGGLAFVAALICLVGGWVLLSLWDGGGAAPNDGVVELLTEAEVLESAGRYQDALDVIDGIDGKGEIARELSSRADRLERRIRRAQQLHDARVAFDEGDFAGTIEVVAPMLEQSPGDTELVRLLEAAQRELAVAAAKVDAAEAEPEAAEPNAPAEQTASSAPSPRPGPAKPEVGWLLIKANVDGILVSIDGTAAEADGELELSPGPHTVRTTAPGHLPSERSVEVEAGARLVVDVLLEPEPAPEPTPAPVPPAPVEPEPAPEPAAPAVQRDAPSLPERFETRSLDEIVAVCAQVEQALIGGGIAAEAARGSTRALQQSLEADFTPGRPIVLHPRGMYRFVADQALAGAKPQAIRAGLLRAHAQGRL